MFVSVFETYATSSGSRGCALSACTLCVRAVAYGLFAIIGAEYVLRLLPRGTHSWRSFVRPSELSASARAAGLTTQQLMGMTYNPFTEHYSLNHDTSVNYLMATKK